MPVYESEKLNRKELEEVRRKNVCAVCGGWLALFWDSKKKLSFVACNDWLRTHHDGVGREFTPPSERNTIARREVMDKSMVAKDQELASRNLPVMGRMTEAQAIEVCKVYWPDAPAENVKAAAYLCRDFGFHPGANHIYLIPYNKKDSNGKVIGQTWEMLWSIAAKRLAALNRKGVFSYIDDTPRLMTEEEQKRIFGKLDDSKVRAITKLRSKEGMEAAGYGEISRSAKVKGEDKGNSVENQAMVRSEGRALDRLPGIYTLPNIEVVDEQYMETPSGMVDKATGEILPPEQEAEAEEGEFTEIPDDNEEIPEPEPETAADENAASKESISELKKYMKEAGATMSDLGKMMANDLKWKVPKTLFELKQWQVDKLIELYRKSVGS